MSILKDRLYRESALDAALHVSLDGTDLVVKGRGDLHIGVLLEKLRREGYELESTCPTVITRIVDGEELESVERVEIDVEEKYGSMVMDRIMHREGDIISMDILESGNQK